MMSSPVTVSLWHRQMPGLKGRRVPGTMKGSHHLGDVFTDVQIYDRTDYYKGTSV